MKFNNFLSEYIGKNLVITCVDGTKTTGTLNKILDNFVLIDNRYLVNIKNISCIDLNGVVSLT